MQMELGRGPIEFLLVEVETALDEKIIDLPIGARGFRLKDRANAATLRYSNIKGEVGKATTEDPKPVFWTIPVGTQFDGLMGIRNMQKDATGPGDEALGDQADGTVLEQRFYITSESDSTDIEVMIVPGS